VGRLKAQILSFEEPGAELRLPQSMAETPAAPPSLLPVPLRYTEPPPQLLAQGAEAIVYRTHFLTPDNPCALKYRPAKTWRHATLDARLTRHRILAEARVLVKCRREGVSVPAVLGLDWEGREIEGGGGRRGGGWMIMEWVEGETVRRRLDDWLKADGSMHQGLSVALGGAPRAERYQEAVDLMKRIGQIVGKLHSIGVVHGDLTTSNLILRCETLTDGDLPPDASARTSLKGEVVLIDFGLAAQSVQDEDRAVDLYVLERAFGSTHPMMEDLFEEVLKAYGASYRGGKVALKRLEEVRMRGRKRSMVG
jgi:TP53 regulating kinase and related kinases